MGTWGYQAFDNDHALDWADELVKAAKPLLFLDRTLKAALKTTDDSYECDRAVAAAEVLAALRGYSNKALPESVVSWLKEAEISVADEISARAIQACQKVLDESELRELHENYLAWRKSILNMISRLEKSAKPRVRKKLVVNQSAEQVQVKAACKAIEKAGGYVIFEKGVPDLAGTDAKVDSQLIENFATLTTLKSLSIGLTPNAIPRRVFEPLVALKQLQSLELSNARITNEDHSPFAMLPKLKNIHLNSTAIDDEGLAAFTGAKHCETLTLNDTKVTDAGLKALSGLTNLKQLEARRTKLTDAALETIGKFTKLQYLELTGVRIKGSGVGKLSGLLKLQGLALSETAVDDRAVATLGHLRIAWLRLAGTKVVGSCFGATGRFLKLMNLQLDGCSVTEAGCKEIGKLAVKTLSLSNTPLTDKGLANLLPCSRLECLDLSGTKVTDAAMLQLSSFKSLRHVNLSSTKISDNGLAVLAKQQKVNSIILNNTQITLQGLDAFLGNPTVSRLGIEGNSFSYAQGLAMLKKIRASQPRGKEALAVF